jgi:DNA-directed RNA polymerase subunit RPC12/RpoP
MEPIMCPYCGGTSLHQEEDYSLEMDFEYWTIHHWECMECGQSFDKIEVVSTANSFEAMNESTIH